MAARSACPVPRPAYSITPGSAWGEARGEECRDRGTESLRMKPKLQTWRRPIPFAPGAAEVSRPGTRAWLQWRPRSSRHGRDIVERRGVKRAGTAGSDCQAQVRVDGHAERLAGELCPVVAI